MLTRVDVGHKFVMRWEARSRLKAGRTRFGCEEGQRRVPGDGAGPSDTVESIRMLCCGCTIRSGNKTRNASCARIEGGDTASRIRAGLAAILHLGSRPGVVFGKIYGKVWTTWFPWLELGRKGIRDLCRMHGRCTTNGVASGRTASQVRPEVRDRIRPGPAANFGKVVPTSGCGSRCWAALVGEV